MTDIADKIRFWEEQQRINSVLVPRVVEGARSLEALAGEVAELSDRLRHSESRSRTARRAAFIAIGCAIAAVLCAVVSGALALSLMSAP